MLNYILILQLIAFFSFGIGKSDLSLFYLGSLALLYFYSRRYSKNLISNTICLFTIFVCFLVIQENSLAKLIASLILIIIVYSISRDERYQLNVNVIFFFSLIWFSGTLLTILKPDFFSFFMYRIGVYSGRGVSGLTAEPSLLGTYSAMYLGIVFHKLKFLKIKNSKISYKISKERIKLQIACLLMIFCTFASQSAYGIIFLVLIMMYFRVYTTIIFGFLIFTISLLLFTDNASRIYILVSKLISGEFNYFTTDFSIMHRVRSIYVFLFPSSYQVGNSLSGGLSPLVYLFGWVGQLLVVVLLFLFRPFREAIMLGSRSIVMIIFCVVLFVVGPITLVPFWMIVALEARNV